MTNAALAQAPARVAAEADRAEEAVVEEVAGAPPLAADAAGRGSVARSIRKR
jgi:hypothetical protein